MTPMEDTSLHHIKTEIYTFTEKSKEIVSQNEIPKIRNSTLVIACGGFAGLVHGIVYWKRLLTRSAAKSFSKGDSKYSNRKVEEELGIKGNHTTSVSQILWRHISDRQKSGWKNWVVLPLVTIILTTTIHLVTGNYRAFHFSFQRRLSWP